MTITQLEYTIAVATHKSFVAAAERCFVTQPTLSMQIAKLEDELGVKIFDRNKQPIQLTPIGMKVVEQAKKVIYESQAITEIVKDHSGLLSGTFTIGVIPTIASYLVPELIKNFSDKYQNVTIVIKELLTSDIIRLIHDGNIDCGILSTPLDDNIIIEHPLFEEQLVVYAHKDSDTLKKKTVSLDDLDMKHMWIMNEGNCLRNQVFNMCAEYKVSIPEDMNYRYESGNVYTLKNMVSIHGGFTILPELIAKQVLEIDHKNVRYFDSPVPVREISVITSQQFFRRSLLDALIDEIMKLVPAHMHIKKNNHKIQGLKLKPKT